MHVPDGQGQLFLLNNTYKSVRLICENYNLYYSVWCNNEHELYDLTVSLSGIMKHLPHEATNSIPQTDPGQLNNLFLASKSSPTTLLGKDVNLVIHRLDALLMVLKSCTGETCAEPWKVLHPQGDVASLSDALTVHFDAFYEEQVKVSFNRCELGYIIDAEGPQAPYQYRVGTSWSDWT